MTRAETVVMPILGRIIPNLKSAAFNISRKELNGIVTIPIEDLCNPSMIGYTQFRNKFSVPVFLGTKNKIWGVTAVMTNMCLSAILPSKTYNHRIKYIPAITRNKEH